MAWPKHVQQCKVHALSCRYSYMAGRTLHTRSAVDSYVGVSRTQWCRLRVTSAKYTAETGRYVRFVLINETSCVYVCTTSRIRSLC